jgi:alkylation response protein AidB-like acyl-CoA dehydrogenase
MSEIGVSGQHGAQIEAGWGAGPSGRYEELAAQFRPLFNRIRENSAERDRGRILPYEELEWVRESGLSTLRLPVDEGGFGATLPELFGLLIELSEADPNITNVLRPHFGFTEDVLNSTYPDWQKAWFRRLSERALVGNGFSETGEGRQIGKFTTKLVKTDDKWILNGEKYYTTGSLFADWINLGGVDEDGNIVGAVISRHSPGVEVLDDWDGFGQALTASGTAIFSDVAVDAELLRPPGGRCKYVGSFFQLVHLATLAGIARAAATDLARLLGERKRVYGHGNAPRSAEDPQLLQVVGRVRANAYGAGAIALKAAEALQRSYESRTTTFAPNEDRTVTIADLEVSQAVSVVTSLTLEATTILFDALGASATKREYGLDRHWRNARTISSHNPRIFRDRDVGFFGVTGDYPQSSFAAKASAEVR